jgi:hypothetical protein
MLSYIIVINNVQGGLATLHMPLLTAIRRCF